MTQNNLYVRSKNLSGVYVEPDTSFWFGDIEPEAVNLAVTPGPRGLSRMRRNMTFPPLSQEFQC